MLAAASQEPGFSASANVFTVCPETGLHIGPITLHQALLIPSHCHPGSKHLLSKQEGDHHAGVLPSHCHRGTPSISPIPDLLALQSPLQAGPYTLHPDFLATDALCTMCRNLKGVTQGRVSYRTLRVFRLDQICKAISTL